jgi:5-methylcytosine-specific restriction endonuclease McrA
MGRRVRINPAVQARLNQRVRGARRETIYKMIAKRNCGQVPCFVCGRHVAHNRATLEHIVRRRDGGTDDMSNLSISHEWCNSHRDAIEARRA